MKARIAVVALCAGVATCSSQRVATQVVYLIDASASIPVEARASMGKSLALAAAALNRGDELIIVPITGAALTDTPDHVLRFRLKLSREPYDADRRRLATEVEASTGALLKRITAKPFQQTDLLGAFDFAAEEFAGAPQRMLICLSDFIQDDRQFDFKRDSLVSDAVVAARSGSRLAQKHGRSLSGVSAYLGTLQSTDLRGLSGSRQAGIRAFWISFLEGEGATVSWKTDGLGHLADFMTRSAATRSASTEDRLR